MPDTVLITGASGFSGSFLAEEYERVGWEVHGTYLQDAPEVVSSRSTCLHRLDLRDRDATQALVRRVRPHVIQHLAAQSSVAFSWDDPAGTLVDNMIAQLNLLECVLDEAPEATTVVVGSCDEYGNVAEWENPVSEQQELRPVSPYAVSKVSQDLMGYQYAVSRSMAVIRVRPFMQLGPRRSDRFVAGSFARQVAEIECGLREPVIEVGNLDLIRDFTDVRDVARAFVALASSGVPGEVYNIASGSGRSVRELLYGMIRLSGTGADVRARHQLQRRGEPAMLVGDATRLRQATGWQPAISFEQSVADTLSYWRKRVRHDRGIEV